MSNTVGTQVVETLTEEPININVSDSAMHIWQDSSVHSRQQSWSCVKKFPRVKVKGLNTTNADLPNNGLVSATVGKTFSLAERDTKRANGTSQRHRVKYAITCEWNVKIRNWTVESSYITISHEHIKMTLTVGYKFEKRVTMKIQMFLDKTLSCWVSNWCCKWLRCLHIHYQAVFFLDWLAVKALQVLESLAVTHWTTQSHIQKHLSPIPLYKPKI